MDSQSSATADTANRRTFAGAALGDLRLMLCRAAMPPIDNDLLMGMLAHEAECPTLIRATTRTDIWAINCVTAMIAVAHPCLIAFVNDVFDGLTVAAI